MRAFHQTSAAFQLGAGLAFAVVAALVGPGTWASAVVAACFAPVFTFLVARGARRGDGPAGVLVRHPVRGNLAIVAFCGAILAITLALGDVGWTVPAILLGSGAGHAILARG